MTAAVAATGGGPDPGGEVPVVEITDLRKSYGGRAVLRGVTLEVAAGEIVALLGPNGAGKTTTVEIIEGYRRPDGGLVRVLGHDPARAGRDHRARVGLMLQGGGGIDPRLTAREVVALHARFHARPRPAEAVLADVGLSPAVAGTRYRRLSGGERQRVALALALVGRPALAVLDEPTAGLDVEGRGRVRDVLGEVRASGAAILLTSHDLGDVERVADRIAILAGGRIVAEGRPDELAAGGGHVLRFRLAAPLDDADRADLANRLGSAIVADDVGAAAYRVPGIAATAEVIARLAAWCGTRDTLIVELRTGGGTLEERYLELTGGGGDEKDEPAS